MIRSMAPGYDNRTSHAARNPELSKERILSAALAEFSAKGFAGARVDAIARRARINKRMLYHYFGDKEVLFREVLRRKISERRTWGVSAPENPRDRLVFWFELACRDREWIRLLEWEALQWGETTVVEEASRKEAANAVLERIRELQAKGTVTSRFPAGQLLLSMMALTTYPLAFPQLTRLLTGYNVSDPEFQKQRAEFLQEFAAAFAGTEENGREVHDSDC